MCPQVIRGGPSANLLPGPAVPGRAADIARHQMRVGIPESMKSQHLRQYAPKCGSPICAPPPGSAHRLLNDALRHNWQLLVLVLAQCT